MAKPYRETLKNRHKRRHTFTYAKKKKKKKRGPPVVRTSSISDFPTAHLSSSALSVITQGCARLNAIVAPIEGLAYCSPTVQWVS